MLAKLKNYGITAIAILLGSALFSCESTVGDLTTGTAYIKIINASPDDSKIDFYMNDTIKNTVPLAFGDNTGLLTVSGGTNSIYTKLNDNIINRSQLSLFLKENKSFTFFIAGKISKDSLVYVATEDNLTAPTNKYAKVKFVNVCPNSPYLDAVFSKNMEDSVANFTNINFKSGSAYKEFLPGDYIVKLREAGKKISLANNSGFTLVAGKIYTLWAKGSLNGTGDYALATGMLTEN